MTFPRAWIEIDLNALIANTQSIRRHANNCELMAVVKANGYGHGLVESARAAIEGGASWLGVAAPEEALELRHNGIEGPLLTWMLDRDNDFARIINQDIDLAVSSLEQLNRIFSAAEDGNIVARVHIKVDTGLGRNGVTMAELPKLIKECVQFEKRGHLETVGIMSHMAYADEPLNPTVTEQIEKFIYSIDLMHKYGLNPEVKHLANSAAAMALPKTHLNLIRPGLAIFGISPGPLVNQSSSLSLKPVMTLKAKVSNVKMVPAGQGVSYAHQYFTQQSTQLALIPLGYSDGIPRAATNSGPLSINGNSFKISGRVCMDQFVVDVGQIEIREGDVATLFGDPTLGFPSVDDWASASDTINYEILTRIGPRLHRIYSKN